MEQQHTARLIDRDDALAAVYRLFAVAAFALPAVLMLAVGFQLLRSSSAKRVLEERKIGRLARVAFALAVAGRPPSGATSSRSTRRFSGRSARHAPACRSFSTLSSP